MPKYLVAIHRPHGYDPSVEDEVMSGEIDELNDEMLAAGSRVFVGGLQLPDQAASLRLQDDGTVAVSSGHYLQSDEFVGGLWVIEAASMDEATEWGRKAALACRCGVEVRPFH